MVIPLGSVSAVMVMVQGDICINGQCSPLHLEERFDFLTLVRLKFDYLTLWSRPRALTITSFIAATSSAEVGGHHDFAHPGLGSGSVTRSNSLDSEAVSGRVHWPYRLFREGFTPFPWILADGE
uniref:Uncharacterized protein n=1 Tax=Oryza brachyantha TaxID=4533 RepID=J3MUV1_ORYBR